MANAPAPVSNSGKRLWRYRGHELLPCGPQGSEARSEQDTRECHSNACAPPGRPSEGHEDEAVHRGVFEKIDTVGEQRDRTDRQRDRKLDAKISKVQGGNESNGSAETAFRERFINHQRCSRHRTPGLRASNHPCISRADLSASLCNRVKQITHEEQRETKNSTGEIEIVTNAMLAPPVHPRKQLKCFGHMSEYDHHQASRAE